MAVTPIQSLVSSLPPEVLAKIPAIAAPLGITSNLVNPTSRGWVLAIVSSILAGLMIVCYAIRVYTRLAIQRKVTCHSTYRFLSARTLKGITFSVSAAALELGIDVYLFILPLIAVIRLHLPMRKRIPAMMMFNVRLLNVDLDIGIMLCCFLPMRLFLRTYRHTCSRVAVALASCFTDESKQGSAITRPAPTKALDQKRYPNLDVTSPLDFEGSGLSSKGCNGMSTQKAGENAFPIATHELRR
ncbi:hypothetical protein BCON_0051g00410 [Botryotinia convoluta]|uniref:Integral membrane protein n=1 Tax=Botryotinia convoluta TaxID=54673 RepID=A0A4Z1IB19_9HELO|nr:hypothetical protein BCON_0051g00410 [Botryotinia convoluta]